MKDCEGRKKFTMQYWQYYCMLEEDCVSLRKFVDFREENMSTCSDEIIKQILSVCSEFDGLCKEITGIKKVKMEDGSRERNANITDFGKWFSSKESKIDLNAISVILKNKNIEFKPFENWDKAPDYTMTWWHSYNLVKHCRSENYLLGSLENLLNALAALYFLECFQYKRIAIANTKDGHIIFDVPPDMSELFYIKGLETKAFTIGHGLIGADE